MKPAGLLYLWRNTVSPGDSVRDSEAEGSCGSIRALDALLPYFEFVPHDVLKPLPNKNQIADGSFDILYRRCEVVK